MGSSSVFESGEGGVFGGSGASSGLLRNATVGIKMKERENLIRALSLSPNSKGCYDSSQSPLFPLILNPSPPVRNPNPNLRFGVHPAPGARLAASDVHADAPALRRGAPTRSPSEPGGSDAEAPPMGATRSGTLGGRRRGGGGRMSPLKSSTRTSTSISIPMRGIQGIWLLATCHHRIDASSDRSKGFPYGLSTSARPIGKAAARCKQRREQWKTQLSFVVSADNGSEGSKSSKPSFGGGMRWTGKGTLIMEPVNKLSTKGRYRDAPLLLRLLIAVFPFLGSWTRILDASSASLSRSARKGGQQWGPPAAEGAEAAQVGHQGRSARLVGGDAVPATADRERSCVHACLDLAFTPPCLSYALNLSTSASASPLLIPNIAIRNAILSWCDSAGLPRPAPHSPDAALDLVRSLMPRGQRSVRTRRENSLVAAGEAEEARIRKPLKRRFIEHHERGAGPDIVGGFMSSPSPPRTALLVLLLLVFVAVVCKETTHASALNAATTMGVSPQKLERFKDTWKRLITCCKSIKSPDGDIIDCVLMNKQLALDHPLLKNHKIQKVAPKRPASRSEAGNQQPRNGTTRRAWQAWNHVGNCPEGTVSVRRTTVEDVLRAGSLSRFGKKKVHKRIVGAPYTGHEYAIAEVDQQAYGTKAIIDVWDPSVGNYGEFSLSQIWLVAGSYANSDLNTIEAGWQVSSQIYGDSKTRLFIYWTRDAYNATGCYNSRCPGFVQTSNEVVLGGTIAPVSTYDGDQREITILVRKDPNSGNWWLSYQNIDVGYWPNEIFTHLASYATSVEWGGEIVNNDVNGQHTTTQMGSGHFAEERSVGTIAGNPNCYDIQTFSNAKLGVLFLLRRCSRRKIACTITQLNIIKDIVGGIMSPPPPSALLVLLLLVFVAVVYKETAHASALNAATTMGVSPQKLERIQRFLEKINKPAVKSIKGPDGDIIDCVLMNKQLALDHPLLKNHKIQRVAPKRPASRSDAGNQQPGSGTTRRALQAWNILDNCPDGTVSVQRTTVEDVLRAGSLSRFGKKEVHEQLAATTEKHEYAVAEARQEAYGTKAIIDVWNPSLEQAYEFSLSQIWLTAGSYAKSNINTIEVGWQAYPHLYGDNKTRLFIYWTSDAYITTGCYNLKCPGFVQQTSK
uniref:Neprosin PEP catalytic domain-containing protein n=1 Tax=Ananas comosus var. bracteatus TaxID=296719 RepID=A0A6V7PJL1_ANACO|nr:unnamed protein product [Ananas comosus var. bracteatus]